MRTARGFSFWFVARVSASDGFTASAEKMPVARAAVIAGSHTEDSHRSQMSLSSPMGVSMVMPVLRMVIGKSGSDCNYSQ
ncbi:hypothetical protein D3C83_73000 [compost metagenome]